MTAYQTSDRLALTVDDHGILRGSCVSWVLPSRVRVLFDKADWATVPSQAVEGSNRRCFRCDLPPSTVGGSPDGLASVLDEDGRVLASIQVQGRLPKRNGAGLSALEVLDVHDRPFLAVPYMSFDGGNVTIVGSHLPPGGDPSALGVEFGPGVIYDFQYPIESPEWAAHFWYWPNAIFSNFMLRINLAASARDSDPFSFRFTYGKGPQKNFPEPYGRVWIPRDMRASVGLPQDPTQLTRVQTWSDCRTVTMTGYNAYQVISALFDRYGVSRDGTTIMDWGCGHGRVTRHFIEGWPRATIIGSDIDLENVAWAGNHLPGTEFVHLPLLPPCTLPDCSLDAVFSISVMTHLALDVQLQWLTELARLVRPGGIVLMSFGGPGAVAWSSVWNGAEYFQKWREEGFHADRVDLALDGKISSDTYYRNTAQTHEHVREYWSDYFHVIEIIPESIGNLDFAVLRRYNTVSDAASVPRRVARRSASTSF